MRRRHWFQVATTTFVIAAVRHAIRSRQSHGRFKGVPFEFRIPTPGRIRERVWNPEDRRIFTPHVFGVGWALNFYQIREKWRQNCRRWERLRRMIGGEGGREGDEPESPSDT